MNYEIQAATEPMKGDMHRNCEDGKPVELRRRGIRDFSKGPVNALQWALDHERARSAKCVDLKAAEKTRTM
jgi:hypothetical protein